MTAYDVEIKLLSPLHLSSGQSDVNVDAEVVHDKFGLPYFPGKRFKGLLYESALEVVEMADCASVHFVNRSTVEELFGHVGGSSVQIIVNDLRLPDYEKLCEGWKYLQSKFGDFMRADDVLKEYSSVRFQTAIDKETGTALAGTLHNLRVVDAGLTFTGKLELLGGEKRHITTLALAMQNLKNAGLKRMRGFGHIQCSMPNQEVLVRQAFEKGAAI